MLLADVSSFQLLSSCCHNGLVSNMRATEHNHVIHLHHQLPVMCNNIGDAGTFKDTCPESYYVHRVLCASHAIHKSESVTQVQV